MEDEDTQPPPSRAGRSQVRLAPIEGLRGVAIVLVVLSHGWVLWPTEGLLASPFAGFFRSGNLAVSIFLVLAGFFMTRSLLGDSAAGGVDIKESMLRRWARISAHVYALVLAMLLATALDAPGTYAPADTPRSAFRIMTYTWNWFAMREPLLSRPDAGHLWFTSVYIQVAIFLVLLVAVLGRRRFVLVWVFVALVIAVTAWRAWSAGNEGDWVAFLRTTTRMDGMMWGALLATALPWLPRLTKEASTVLLSLSVVALALLSLTAKDSTYFGAAGVAICASTAVLVWAVVSGGRGPAATVLSTRPLLLLGTYSMALYIWHYPVFWSVSRHTTSWETAPKVILALAIVAALTYASQRWVEGPVSVWLAGRRERTKRPPQPAAPTARGLRER